jgi:hypothetical protein
MLTTWHPLSAIVGNHFADKQRSLGGFSSLADSDYGVFFSPRHGSHANIWLHASASKALGWFKKPSAYDEENQRLDIQSIITLLRILVKCLVRVF